MNVFSVTADDISEKLKRLGQTVSVAESSTGGLIAANLLAVPGASKYFVGGSVVYTLQSRRAFLTFDKEKVKGLEPLSKEMVMAFAEAARDKLDTTWGVAELGASGPAGTPYGHGPGISVIGIAGPSSGFIKIETHSDDRQANMLAFTQAALALFDTTIGATR